MESTGALGTNERPWGGAENADGAKRLGQIAQRGTLSAVSIGGYAPRFDALAHFG